MFYIFTKQINKLMKFSKNRWKILKHFKTIYRRIFLIDTCNVRFIMQMKHFETIK